MLVNGLRLAELARWIVHKTPLVQGKRTIVTLAGPTGVGKSTLARSLASIIVGWIGENTVGVFQQDCWFYPDDELATHHLDPSQRNSPQAVNVQGMLEQLAAFKVGQQAQQPVLERKPGRRWRTGEEVITTTQLLIPDGGFALNNDSEVYRRLFDIADLRLFVDAELDDIRRWWTERSLELGYTDAEERWQRIVRFVHNEKRCWANADLVLTKDNHHRLCLFIIRSLLAKGRSSIDKIKEVELLPTPPRVLDPALTKLAEVVNTKKEFFTHAERNRAQQILEVLRLMTDRGSVGTMDLLVKDGADYLLAFGDSARDRIGFIHDFLDARSPFHQYLPALLCYLGLMHTGDGACYLGLTEQDATLQEKLFGAPQALLPAAVQEFLDTKARPACILSRRHLTGTQLERLEQLDPPSTTQLKALLPLLEGRQIVFVTPTAKSGGVAEGTRDLIQLFTAFGVDVEWVSLIRHQHPDFWGVSGKIYGALEGRGTVSRVDLDAYEATMQYNMERLNTFRDGILFFLHDPYALGLIPLLRERYPKAGIIWVIHGDLSGAGRDAKELLTAYLKNADAIATWDVKYVPEGLSKSVEQFPLFGVNPFSLKERVVSGTFIRSVYDKYGLDYSRPLVLQVARFTPSKDPLASISSFLQLETLLPRQCSPQLAIVGVTISGGDWHFYANLSKLVELLGDRDIHVLVLNNQYIDLTVGEKKALQGLGLSPKRLDGIDQNWLELNALQRGAAVILQPSVAEAFGLTVTEALWKGKSVIATAVGGLSRQVINGQTGWLITVPADDAPYRTRVYTVLANQQFDQLMTELHVRPLAASLATALAEALQLPKGIRKALGLAAKQHVRGALSHFTFTLGLRPAGTQGHETLMVG